MSEPGTKLPADEDYLDRIRKLLDSVQRKLTELQKPCVWTPKMGLWLTGCGHVTGPAFNCKFCGHCGHPIEEKCDGE